MIGFLVGFDCLCLGVGCYWCLCLFVDYARLVKLLLGVSCLFVSMASGCLG